MTRLVTALLFATALAAAAQPAGRAPRTGDEFDALFQQVKNWGRWGADDQLGSVNLVTAAKRKQAAALAKVGLTVSLAHDLLTERAEDNASPFEHTMLRGNNMDRYAVSYHGYAHSHIDALCHILYKDQTYNGYPRAEVNTDKGCTKLGIQNLKAGVVTRGVLVDIPRLQRPAVPRAGDANLCRGPRGVGEESGREDRRRRRAAGPDRPMGAPRRARPVECRPERRRPARVGCAVDQSARRRALLGGDAAQDVVPSMVEGIALPIHTLMITGPRRQPARQPGSRGGRRRARAKLNRWEFMLTIAPMPVAGGTGLSAQRDRGV